MLIFLSLLTIYAIIIDANSFFDSIIATLNIWFYKIYPSVFTFSIIGEILLKKGFFKKLSFLIKPFFKFESSNSYELFILAILIGNPGIINIASLKHQNCEITDFDLKKITLCAIFMNPIFLIAFFNIITIIIIIIIELIASFIINLFLKPNNNININNNNNINYTFQSLLLSTTNTIDLLLNICGIMTIVNIFKCSFMLFLTKIIQKKIFLIFFLLTNIEVSTGTVDLFSLNLSTFSTFSLAMFVLPFQGISINLQTYNIISEKLKLLTLLKVRLIGSLICFFIALIYCYFTTSMGIIFN